VKRTLREEPPVRDERELLAPVDLCDARGNLSRAALGWSRHPLHRCNLRGHWPRKKRWNYWAITSDKYLFSATVAHIDYLALASVYFLDFETGRMVEQTVTKPLGLGVSLPETVTGDIKFRDRQMRVSLADSGSSVRIRAASARFGGAELQAELEVGRPAGHETLNVVIPWGRDRFHFTSKQNCLPASGTVRLGGGTYTFEPGNSFGCLDFGRGVWRYDCFWNWGAASGVQAGRIVGLNLGGGWTGGTGMTENGVCVDGRLSKIGEDLSFQYDRSDFMQPWSVRTSGSSRVDLRFVPFFERVAKSDLLVVRSETHQVFGRYSGTVVTDAGEALPLDGLLGWVEQHQARW
jgi:hypothetical protein